MIISLSLEQESILSDVTKKWSGLWLSTDPIDQSATEDALIHFYRSSGLTAPKKIIWHDSPMAGALHSVRLIPPGERIDDILFQSINSDIFNSEYKIERKLREEVEIKIYSTVGENVYRQMYGRISAQIWIDMIRSFHGAGAVDLEHYPAIHGDRWVCIWNLTVSICRHLGISLYDFYSRIGISKLSINSQIDLSLLSGFMWLYKDLAILSKNPCEFHLDPQGRLHSDTGMAVKYLDGWGVYCVHGVVCPAWLFNNPEKLNADAIYLQKNIELRRVMIDRFGMDRFVREIGVKPVHTDEYGTLYACHFHDDENLVLVEVVNGTPEPDGEYRRYMLRVPPQMTTAKEAVAWTYGLSPEEYDLAVRT